MSDLIRRTDVIDFLEQQRQSILIGSAGYTDANEIADTIEVLKTILSSQLTIKSVQQWIPCSERLPEEGESVQVTFIGYNDRLPHCDKFAYFHNKKWFWCYDHDEVIVKIVAWKPNCEPYKGALS